MRGDLHLQRLLTRENIQLWGQRLRRLVYLLIVILLAAFLFRLGTKPWLLAVGNLHVLAALMLTSGIGLIVQARSFKAVVPSSGADLRLSLLVNIWAMSALVSVIAPVFAGIATRTVLLLRAGMSLGGCVATSSRQIWLGLEFAMLLAALSLPFTTLPNAILYSLGVSGAWLTLVIARYWASTWLSVAALRAKRLIQRWQSLGERVPSSAYPWFILQVLLMSATYYLGFNGMGAHIGWADSVALSSLTVLLSLIVFVPNGLGITDMIWVYIAAKTGLSLEEAVAVAIVLRLSHLLAALSLTGLTWRRN